MALVASLPSLNAGQLEAQRGNRKLGEKSCDAKTAERHRIRKIGFRSGIKSSLQSHGSFSAGFPEAARRKVSVGSGEKVGDCFLDTFIPLQTCLLGRFRQWLIESGNFEKYMGKLVSAFNQCAVDKLMCRTLISVSWDGYLYDCDFNQAEGIPAGGIRKHISEVNCPPRAGNAHSSVRPLLCLHRGIRLHMRWLNRGLSFRLGSGMTIGFEDNLTGRAKQLQGGGGPAFRRDRLGHVSRHCQERRLSAQCAHFSIPAASRY